MPNRKLLLLALLLVTSACTKGSGSKEFEQIVGVYKNAGLPASVVPISDSKKAGATHSARIPVKMNGVDMTIDFYNNQSELAWYTQAQIGKGLTEPEFQKALKTIETMLLMEIRGQGTLSKTKQFFYEKTKGLNSSPDALKDGVDHDEGNAHLRLMSSDLSPGNLMLMVHLTLKH